MQKCYKSGEHFTVRVTVAIQQHGRVTVGVKGKKCFFAYLVHFHANLELIVQFSRKFKALNLERIRRNCFLFQPTKALTQRLHILCSIIS